MNYWEQNPSFWESKINGSTIYDVQGKELGDHINALATELGAKTVLDVGGYKSRMRQYIKPTLTYFNYDIINGMDITKPWERLGEPRIKYDILMTSLTLLCFSPEDVEHIMWEMKGHATKAIVLFEEDWHDRISFEHGSKMNDDYGGKWQYNWLKVLKAHDDNVQRLQSAVNPHWAIYTQKL